MHNNVLVRLSVYFSGGVLLANVWDYKVLVLLIFIMHKIRFYFFVLDIFEFEYQF